MEQKKEKWEEVYSPKELKIVQEIEKNILITLLDVCEKIDVEPIMYGGTLIGCIRHKGFVPWDDDIDVAFVRKDYDKFIKLAPTLLPDDFSLQTPYTEKNTPYFYAKLRRKGCTCIEFYNHKANISKGVYIDIYPIDNIPDDDRLYKKQHKIIQILMSCWYIRQSFYLPYGRNGWKRFVLLAIRLCLRIIPRCIFRYTIYKMLTKFNHIETKRKNVINYPKVTNWYEPLYPLINAKFEGIDVKIPNDWDNHLRRRYGDYMSMPPPEERLGHKPYQLDVKKFYKECL